VRTNARTGVPKAKLNETRIGRTMACQVIPDKIPFEVSWEMMEAITSPAISSNRAALIRTTPTFVFLSRGSSNAMVVPREVEQSAAPAVNACDQEYLYPKGRSSKDTPMGTKMPVMATTRDRTMLRKKRDIWPERPASKTIRMSPMYPRAINVSCAEEDRMLDAWGPKIIPTRRGPMRPAWITLVQT
jgi:hypothetical protein